MPKAVNQLVEGRSILQLLADRCGLPLRAILHLAACPRYKARVVEVGGKQRTFFLARGDLAAVQHEISRLPFVVHHAAHGYVRGRSIVTNAACHLGARTVVQCDLKDFFTSILPAAVREAFVRIGVKEEELETLTNLVLVPVKWDKGTRPVLAQGVASSPAIANSVLYTFDSCMRLLAFQWKLQYTRYVDDLTYSGDLSTAGARVFLRQVRQLVHARGFELSKKTSVKPGSQQQEVVGVTINNGCLRAPRELRHKIRAAIHKYKRGLDADLEQIRGWIEYVGMINPSDGDRLRARLTA